MIKLRFSQTVLLLFFSMRNTTSKQHRQRVGNAAGVVFYSFGFCSPSWTGMTGKLTVSRPQDSQIVPRPNGAWRCRLTPPPVRPASR